MRSLAAATAIVCALSLSGCASLIAMKSNASDLWEWASWSMSGMTLRQPQEYVRDAVQEVTELKTDVEERVGNIGEGVQKLKEGTDLIKEGLGTGTGSVQ
ncbi:MAG: hypothetical protein PHU04_03290 [Candidatus Peribacteraceae bacterium]|nr:hypothetical protein [Candidatus Peribacteraceae bacterium]